MVCFVRYGLFDGLFGKVQFISCFVLSDAVYLLVWFVSYSLFDGLFGKVQFI